MFCEEPPGKRKRSKLGNGIAEKHWKEREMRRNIVGLPQKITTCESDEMKGLLGISRSSDPGYFHIPSHVAW